MKDSSKLASAAKAGKLDAAYRKHKCLLHPVKDAAN
jgi:hypothetical protein